MGAGGRGGSCSGVSGIALAYSKLGLAPRGNLSEGSFQLAQKLYPWRDFDAPRPPAGVTLHVNNRFSPARSRGLPKGINKSALNWQRPCKINSRISCSFCPRRCCGFLAVERTARDHFSVSLLFSTRRFSANSGKMETASGG